MHNQQPVPLSPAAASLGATPAPAAAPITEPVAPAAPAPAPTTPFTVMLVNSTGEHPIIVASAKLQLVRDGKSRQAGTVVLRATVHGNPNIDTLLSMANVPAPYTLVIKYFAPDGSVLRADNIAVNPESRVTYGGPELVESEKGWEFFETLTIHA